MSHAAAALLCAAIVAPVTWSACNGPAPEIAVIEARNGSLPESPPPFLYEDLRHPLLTELAQRERLADAVAPGRTEWERLVRLREWTASQWSNASRGDAPEPYPNAAAILRRIRSGELPGGMCSEYAAVLMQACLALGHQARLVSLASASGAGHRVVEVWSNDFGTWAVLDPLFDLHYERDGRPLRALDLHRALLAGDARGVVVRAGSARRTRPDLAALLESYRHLTVIMRNNHLTLLDRAINRPSLGWVDEGTDGRPGFSTARTSREADLYWPLNQTRIEVDGRAGDRPVLALRLGTDTPGFDRFEARSGGDPAWRAVGPEVAWEPRRGEDAFEARAVNVRGVRGPAASLRVRRGG